MADLFAEGGRIVTFYSFKGGVGRTMALANVAFLAAMNGQRVLVMDWDLEAPGLDFYFRGLSDPERARQVKAAPGVLNLAWDWRRQLGSAGSSQDLDSLLQAYEDGRPFAECACSVLDEGRHDVGRLDIIGAGSDWIEDDTPLSYAEALVRFSWTDFFDFYGGGLFIERLRRWAKANYDLILVDSRTGFADVAGICTIQLPDAVALTFIYNRQNIEGIAKVARSIHEERQDAVVLRAIPMRTSRQGLLDEAEARSRATNALVRSGAFSADAARSDLEQLSIRAAQNVPFYETIAPFATLTARDDQLSLDYRRLAEVISGVPIQMVEIPASWRETVNRRLEYKTVTLEYLEDLREAEPQRIADELERLLEGAAEADIYDGLNPDYLIALVYLALDLDALSFDEVDAARLERLGNAAIALIRHRWEVDPLQWAQAYASALEQYQTTFDAAGSEEEVLDQLRLLDDILSTSQWTPSVMLRRSGYWRRMATLTGRREPSRALDLLDRANEFLEGARNAGTSAESADNSDLLLQRAGLLERLNRNAEAKAIAETLIARIGDDVHLERRRQASAAHLILLRLEDDPERAASHLSKAMEDESALISDPGSLTRIVEVVNRSTNRSAHAVTLMERMAAPRTPRTRQTPATFFGRTIPYARAFVAASSALVGMAASRPTKEAVAAIDGLLRANAQAMTLLERRYGALGVATGLRKSGKAIVGEVATLIQVGTVIGVSPSTLETLNRAAETFERLLSEPAGK